MKVWLFMIFVLIITSGCTPIQEHYKPLYQAEPKKKTVGEDELQ